MSEKTTVNLASAFANRGTKYPYGCRFDATEALPFVNARAVSAVFDGEYCFEDPDVDVFGNITVHVIGLCDRCGDDADRIFMVPFDQTFYKDATSDCYTYNGGRLDIEKALHDELSLSLPTLLLCRDDCKGICVKCGANLNRQSCNCDTSEPNAFSVLKDLKY